MGTILILTVGTTADPLVKAVEEHRKRTNDLRVYLLYGRPLPDQEPSPLEIAYEVRRRAAELGVHAEPREVSDPENLDVCLQAARSLIQSIPGGQRIVIDFTGGTKPLSASVVHAALREPLDALELVFEYTGGPVRDQAGRVIREAMQIRTSERTATEETLRQVLGQLCRFAYRDARVLAQRLPGTGRGGFLRAVVEALYAWDEFDYETSLESLRRHREAAGALSEDEELAPVSRLALTLSAAGEQLVRAVRILRPLQDTKHPATWPTREALELLVADALENAARRLAEGRFTDSVLRSYRAVESAVHARLLAEQINPWHPDWNRVDSAIRDRYQNLLGGRLPVDLALRAGLKLVEVIQGSFSSDLENRLRDLQKTRNYSYLEHGYNRVGEDDARRLLSYAKEWCAHLLGRDLEEICQTVSHDVWK